MNYFHIQTVKLCFMPINQEFKKIIDRIKYEYSINQAQIADRLGVKKTYLSDMINGRVPYNETMAKKIGGAFPPQINGGDTHVTKTPYTPNAHVIENIEYVNIPLVPVRARCGYLSSFGDQQYIDSLPTIPVIIDRAYHGRYMVFEADGDSMDDGSSSAIRDGDKLLCREVQRHLWLPKLHYNDWYFVVVHKTEGISIKQIIDQDEQGNIRCHSLNPLFNDYTLNLDDVSELYNVVKVVERSMRL